MFGTFWACWVTHIEQHAFLRWNLVRSFSIRARTRACPRTIFQVSLHLASATPMHLSFQFFDVYPKVLLLERNRQLGPQNGACPCSSVALGANLRSVWIQAVGILFNGMSVVGSRCKKHTNKWYIDSTKGPVLVSLVFLIAFSLRSLFSTSARV